MVLKSRNTIQKEIMNSEIKKFEEFFSAEELFEKVKLKDENIGIATVYRFLKKLRDENDINSFICHKKQVYSINKSSHCHFVCEKCGVHNHFKVENIDFLSSKINGKVKEFSLEVKGICKNCQGL